MSEINFSESAPGSLNPFPPTAVRRYEQGQLRYVTIATEALRTALSYVDDYLVSSNPEAWRKGGAHGNVIAILGEYGTGKTHLALELLARLRSDPSAHLHEFYLDAPGDTFLSLYKDRFVRRLGVDEVRERVVEFYADIIAEELDASELTSSVASRLRDRQLEPAAVVERFGLMGATYREALQQRLSAVTERTDFGTALSLFVRPEFRDTVWDWLRGHEPDPVLVERGVSRTIETDKDALEALGVFSLLFGGERHRFVLVIDEMEKILSASAGRKLEGSAVLAFKRLLEIVGRTGALLIVCGLQDFFEALPEDARQRVPLVVRPTRLSSDDTIAYIEESQQDTLGERQLTPFNEDVAAYLTDLAGGNARKVVRLCYLAYRAAVAAGTEVTRAMIRNVARDQFEVLRREDVEAATVRILDKNGWPRERDKQFARSKTAQRADFWVPVGDEGSGCAILISQSVLQGQDVAALAKVAKAVRKDVDPSRAQQCLLIVNGYVAESLEKQVDDLFDRVVAYRPSGFADDIEAALSMCIQSIESLSRENEMHTLLSRVDQVNRQASSLGSGVSEVLSLVSNPVLYERAVENAITRIFSRLGGGEGARLTTQFVYVERAFIGAKEISRRLREGVDYLAEREFEGERLEVTLYRSSVLRRGGAVFMLNVAVQAFERTVLDWLQAWAQRNNARTMDAVGDACHAMDRLLSEGSLLEELRATTTDEPPTLIGDTRLALFMRGLTEDDVETLRVLGRDVYYASQKEIDMLGNRELRIR